MKISNFKETSDLGRKGVEAMVPYLKSKIFRDDVQISDRQSFKRYGSIGDVEIIYPINLKKSIRIFVEVKTDYYSFEKTNNFFIETISNSVDNKAGWIETSQADLLMYYFINENLVFIFDMKKLKKYIKGKERCFEERSCGTPRGNSLYQTTGILVPIVELKHLQISGDQLGETIDDIIRRKLTNKT